MKEFRITLPNHAGELARVIRALSPKGVNLRAIAASAGGDQVTVHLIGHDVEATRKGLEAAKVQFTEQEVVHVIVEDKAGHLAAEQLAEASININAIYLTGRADDLVEVALAVDNVKEAKKLLT